jgi:3-oxoacyl-[acyl-carrier protein] reductase
MNLNLKEKKVAIAGASKGLGFSIAKLFLEEGAKVWLTGRDSSSLTDASKKLGNASFTGGDLTDPKIRELFFSDVRTAWRSLDVLILNVGGGKSTHPGIDSPDQEWERMFQLNLFTHVALIRLFTPLLKKSEQASIVSVSSIAGEATMPAPLSYSSAKAALNHFCQTAVTELAQSGIRYNTVTPGNILSKGGRWEQLLEENPQRVEKYIQKVPLKRFGTPEEIANTVVFLSSPLASFCTGSILRVDGGQVLNIDRLGG